MNLKRKGVGLGCLGYDPPVHLYTAEIAWSCRGRQESRVGTSFRTIDKSSLSQRGREAGGGQCPRMTIKMVRTNICQ